MYIDYEWVQHQPRDDWAFSGDRLYVLELEWSRTKAAIDAWRSAEHVGEFEPAELTVTRGANLVRLKAPNMILTRTRGGGVRGAVKGFSAASRRRLLRMVASVRRDALPLFVTLTYPGEFSADGRQWKRDIASLWKRVIRKWPKASAVWRLEFQKRGAPHFHLLLYGVSYFDLMRSGDGSTWLDRSWFEVVGSGDLRHLRAGVNVQQVKTFRGVMWYAAKYISKLPENVSADTVGRYWGVCGRDNLPLGVKVVYTLLEAECWVLRRMLSKHVGIRPRGRKGLSVFCDPEQWERAFLKMVGAQ